MHEQHLSAAPEVEEGRVVQARAPFDVLLAEVRSILEQEFDGREAVGPHCLHDKASVAAVSPWGLQRQHTAHGIRC